MSKKTEKIYTKEALLTDIRTEGRALRLPMGTVESFAEEVAKKVEAWLEGRSAITQDDLNQKISDELGFYHPDLAYIYANRGKII